jgi:hypothetical protein
MALLTLMTVLNSACGSSWRSYTHCTITRHHCLHQLTNVTYYRVLCIMCLPCAQIEAVYEGLLSTGTVAAAMQQQPVTQLSVTPVLTGSASRACAAVLRSLRSENRLFELYRTLFDFFGGCDGYEELWATVAHCFNGLSNGLSTAVPPQGQVEVTGLDLLQERVVHVSQLVPRAQVLYEHAIVVHKLL